MIISASRRTDIPAFYSEWFMNRIKDGYVMTRNPFNYHQISKINLDPKVIDAFVFWTKNPKNMLNKLNQLNQYNYYFLFTLTSYDKSLEKNVPSKKYIIKYFKKLSNKIGEKRVIWRYDPILLTDKFDKQYHNKYFEKIAEQLENHTNECIISYIDLYKKTQKNLADINLIELNKNDMKEIAENLKNIADKYNIKLKTCGEKIDLNDIGVPHGKCIDDKLISNMIDSQMNVNKDPNQREECGCVKSIDIGAYNTCRNNCLYCYATFNKKTVNTNMKKHNPKSPLFLGELTKDDKINEREIKSFIEKKQSLFD